MNTWALSPIVLLGCVAAFLATGCHRKPAATAGESTPPPAATVRVLKVEPRQVLATEEVVGTVRAKTRAQLEAKIAGRIEELQVVTGQAVKAGDLVARLDAVPFQARLVSAQASADQAARDLQRFTALLEQKAVTQAEFDAMEARHRVAQANVTEAVTMLGYARVIAPFDGVITRKLADAGDLAAPGRPLVELEDPATLRLEADVPESLIGRIQPGARLVVSVASVTTPLEGTVSEIAPAADPHSRTFRVKLDLTPTPGLRLGQFGRLTVPLAETSTLRVPASALVTRGQLEIVFVVADGKAHLRLVKTGRRVGGDIELVSGLEPGETIVLEDATRLLDGQPVQPR